MLLEISPSRASLFKSSFSCSAFASSSSSWARVGAEVPSAVSGAVIGSEGISSGLASAVLGVDSDSGGEGLMPVGGVISGDGSRLGVEEDLVMKQKVSG